MLSMWRLQTVKTHDNENRKDHDSSTLKIQRSPWKRNLCNRASDSGSNCHIVSTISTAISVVEAVSGKAVIRACLHSQFPLMGIPALRNLSLFWTAEKHFFLSEFSRNWNEITFKGSGQSKHLIQVSDFFFSSK